jgi:hypothetical protein
MQKVFLLSPASTSGRRAQILLNPEASFDLAVRLRREGAPIKEVFSFLSGLYFRGKVAYAKAFGGTEAPLVITAGKGLVPGDKVITTDTIAEFAKVDIASGTEEYLGPFTRDLKRLSSRIESDARVILLGSIATNKYMDPVIEVFGSRALAPSQFQGIGDMSRGALMLRAAEKGSELRYKQLISFRKLLPRKRRKAANDSESGTR